MSFSKHCPRYSEYQILYADSTGLQALQFLRRCDCLLHASRPSTLNVRHVAFVTSFICPPLIKVYKCLGEVRTFWRPFKTDDLSRFQNDIQQCKLEVDAEITRALHQTNYQERQLQLIDREAAARYRTIGSIFRADVIKSNEKERRWRLQTDERKASAWCSFHSPKWPHF